MGELTDLIEKYDDYCRQKIVAELKKIKAEIVDIRDVEVTDGIIYANEFDVFDILDKRIAELKGENNDR